MRSHVSLYQYQAGGSAQYPMLESMDVDGKPIGWGALSGLAADPSRPGVLYAVNDSFYANKQPVIG